MRLRKGERGGADEDDKPSGEWSWSDRASTSLTSLRALSETSLVRIKLNRQIPESGTPLSPRKQRAADCSNRQKIQFCGTHNSRRELHISSFIRPPSRNRSLPISNRELLGLEILQLAENKHHRPVLIANFEPNDFVVFQAGHSK